MEIRVLKYFLAAAREENITSAAQKLHITQPALSKQLMELEDELGKKLFIRGKRKTTLTEEGIFLKKRAEEIVELTAKTEAEIKLQNDFAGGEIFIGGGETQAMHFIAGIIKKLSDSYPEIKFHIFSGNGEDVEERLDKGLIDFGIFVGLADFKKYNYIKLNIHDSWGLLMRKDCPLAGKDKITSSDLENIPLLCSRQALIQNELSGWLGYSFDSLRIIGTYNLIYNASVFVEEGIGYALAIGGLINTGEAGNLCFRPLEPEIKADIIIAWKRHQAFSKPSEKFLKYLQNELCKTHDIPD